jgi:hypothetical protein
MTIEPRLMWTGQRMVVVPDPNTPSQVATEGQNLIAQRHVEERQRRAVARLRERVGRPAAAPRGVVTRSTGPLEHKALGGTISIRSVGPHGQYVVEHNGRSVVAADFTEAEQIARSWRAGR